MTRWTRRDGDASPARGFTRRRLLAALGAGAAGAVGTAAPAAGRERATGRWPAFQYDRRNTGYAPGERGPTDAAGARWGYLEGDSFESTPVVTGEGVYAADAGAGAVVALDRATGSRRWRVETEVGVSRMTVVGDTLLVPADSLEARSLQDGSLKWTADVGSPDAVVVMGEYAYLTSGAGVSRVSLVDNDVDWHNDRVTRVHPSVSVRDDHLYAVGKQYAQVIALDPPSGSRRWLRRIDGSATGAPTVVGERVYVPTDTQLTAMSAESGIPEWTADVAFGSSVAVAEGTVYGTTRGGRVVALDARSGERQWARAATTGSNPPVVAGGLLYVTGTDGSVAALNPGDGTVVWEAAVGGSRPANVAVAGGELYAGDENGDLAAMAAGESGGLKTATPTPTATPAPTATPEPTPEPAGTPEPTATPTGASGRGFGLLAGAAATGLGAWAALRRRSDGGE